MPLNPNLAAVFPPPVMEARRWVAETTFPADRPLLNFSQAAPVAPPPEALRQAMAEKVATDADIHLYGPVLGDTALRAEIAARWSMHYGADIGAGEVAITSGCNQAFCAAVSSLCGPGDAVMVPVPWYFNHKMWLDMSGVGSVLIPCDGAMLPDIEAARTAMTPAVKAILLITPNNPTGAEYPPELMEAFYDLAREHGAALIIDETYRDFHSGSGAPHDLFRRDDWRDTLVHLYSFSKVFRLTGHRVGAIATGAARLAEIEKFLDTVTICPSRVGQFGALYGLRHLDQWVAGERAEILARGRALRETFAARLPGWRILGAGAYFAWVEPPFDIPSDRLARRLVAEQSVLTLPGTMFTPAAAEGRDWGGERALRIAFANADAAGIAVLADRLAAFRP
ncbi:aminotransferase [Limibaculum sp. M0105]|uniref:aspartate transaminase n=1 Tax=Thermohalobaculum xanthum TaxID=2753746 RepID=A0A8J7SG35_9RHOB|nr:aminotransferase [Thermohalobaculum xanthum]MBK0398810.1 aminotransferase [Thermohalobaculum xanthum]